MRRVADRRGAIYEQSAGVYDRLIGRARQPFFLTLARMLEFKGNENVVDLGCGPGNLTRELFPHVLRCTGVDASATMLAHARAGLVGASWVRGDATRTELPSHSFDAAVSSQLLPWLSDPREFVVEVRRLLRPGGKLGLITAAPGSYREFFHALEKLLRTYEEYFGTDDVGEIFGTHAYSPANLRRLLEQERLDVEKWVVMNVEIPMSVDEYLSFIRAFAGTHYLSRLPADLRPPAEGLLASYLARDGLTLNEKNTILVAHSRGRPTSPPARQASDA